MFKFSFCLIVKNEEEHIANCLEPIKNLDQEIIIVDTGSSDSTISIAQKYTDKIYHFDWINDFSAARNYAMEKAENDFVFFLDADEYTTSFNISKLYSMAQTYPDAIGRITRRNKCLASDNSTIIFIDPVERFFNRKYYYYTGSIHEQVTSRTSKPLTGYMMDWIVYHEGYYASPEKLKEKGQRNAALLLKELESNPNDAYIYYQLGQSYSLYNDYKEALKYYQKGFELHPDKSLEYVELLIIDYGNSLIRNNMAEKVFEFEDEYSLYENIADYLCMLAHAATETGNLCLALEYYRKALKQTKYYTEGCNSTKPYHNMACIYHALGNHFDASIYFAKAGTKSDEQKISDKERCNTTPKITLIIHLSQSNDLSNLLESLRFQTIGIHYLELIFLGIDDICKNEALASFEKEYGDNVIIIADTNTSSPEELFAIGFSYSHSPYILFTGADTFFLPDTLRLLYRAAVSFGSDIVKGNIADIDFNNTEKNIMVRKCINNQISPTLYPISCNEGNNRTVIKQKRLLIEPLENVMYAADYISQIGIPSEDILYDTADKFYIIDNICFIR